MRGDLTLKKKNPLVLKVIKYIEIGAVALSLSVFASQETKPLKIEKNDAEIQYRLSVYDGRIAVFETGETEPVEVFDVFVASLPYNEQIELRNGLTATGRSELQKLIEDYTS